MVKPNTQNKSSATNACPPDSQATSTSVGESPDLLNLISRTSSRAGKCVHPRHDKSEIFHFSRVHNDSNPELDLSAISAPILKPKTYWQYLGFYFD